MTVKRKQGFQKAVQKFAPSRNVTYYDILENNRPILIFCATDNIAIGAIKVIYERNFAVPANISVTGFGAYHISEMIHPSLTTVSFNHHYAGTIAATSTTKLVKNKEASKILNSKYVLRIQGSIDKV
ncbi:substrate-binding domain-containing protein (plasmid) [Bacillus sp. N447-1]|uniref:substrate-binding domain-containing protein n=1 Tax=Bacillus sp. N447-1 TaxID=2789208 RepID=UPI001F612A13|nr:substrate-binding domain-containing protein [Bacillus sp. N447-1]UNT71653.1 substrate-binding domain-containing protein [Bacillus sp. N447-1]